VYRSKRDHRLALAYGRLIRAAATKVQAAVRGWVGRAYVAYLLSHWKAAVYIQKAVRAFLARCTANLLALAAAARRFYNAPLPASLRADRGRNAAAANDDAGGGSSLGSRDDGSFSSGSLGGRSGGRPSLRRAAKRVALGRRLSGASWGGGGGGSAGSASGAAAAKTTATALPNVFGLGGLYGAPRPGPATVARLQAAAEVGGLGGDPCRVDGPLGLVRAQAGFRGWRQRWLASGVAWRPLADGAAAAAGAASADGASRDATLRGVVWRGGFRGRVELEVELKVRTPARRLLQRVVRGHLGRKDLAKRRREWDAATVLYSPNPGWAVLLSRSFSISFSFSFSRSSFE
jgi:hypothetical protein